MTKGSVIATITNAVSWGMFLSFSNGAICAEAAVICLDPDQIDPTNQSFGGIGPGFVSEHPAGCGIHKVDLPTGRAAEADEIVFGAGPPIIGNPPLHADTECRTSKNETGHFRIPTRPNAAHSRNAARAP